MSSVVWKTVPLKEFMRSRGGSIDPALYLNEEFDLFSVPAYEAGKPDHVLGSQIGSTKQIVETNDLLLSKIVPHIRRAWIVPKRGERRMIGSSEWMIFSGKQIHPPYLRHHFLTDRFNQQLMQTVSGVGGSLLRARPSHVAEITIPLPPLAEQKRLAAILDQADAIRRKRQQALRLTDDFLRSVFLDLFGDPALNSKGWKVGALAEGVESFDGGWNIIPTETERPDGFKVLKVSAVTSGEYRPDESKHFAEQFSVPQDYLVRQGDLIISRANTAELVGAVAYVWDVGAPRMLPDKLWRFVWSQPQTIDPLFMLYMAKSKYFRDQLIQRASGSSGSMKNIGKAKMMEIPIPYPPLELQKRFASIVTHTRTVLNRAKTATTEAETLFQSLQHRAFTGQL